MQLLVSVRSASEVEPALAGGADIIDAKEPAHGSLGPVSARTLSDILSRVPSDRPFSVALGDVATEAGVLAAISALKPHPRDGATFLKLGFAGVTSPELVGRLLAGAVDAAAKLPSPPMIIAVAYADAGWAGTVSPDLVCRLAREAGAAGVLVDTYRKDGTCLLDWLSPMALALWVSGARQAGLLSALAGALGTDDLDRVQGANPDVLGFRGAACEGGRSGEVSTARVAALRRQLDRPPAMPKGRLEPWRTGTSQNA